MRDASFYIIVQTQALIKLNIRIVSEEEKSMKCNAKDKIIFKKITLIL